MSLETLADDFLSQKRIAVVGVSRTSGTGNAIFKALKTRGHNVFPVNPKAEEVHGATCYPDLRAIPGGVDAVVVVTPKTATEAVARECAELGVSHVWMHHNALFGKGSSSASETATALCREHGIKVIPGGCPLMFGEKADLGHRCMRWLLRLTGGLPEDL